MNRLLLLCALFASSAAADDTIKVESRPAPYVVPGPPVITFGTISPVIPTLAGSSQPLYISTTPAWFTIAGVGTVGSIRPQDVVMRSKAEPIVRKDGNDWLIIFLPMKEGSK